MKERRMNLGLALLVSAILVISLIPVIAMAGNWEQFQRDAVNSGNTTDAAPTTYWNETVLWRAYTSSTGSAGIDVVPLVVGDLVYVVASNNSVWAFNKTTGAVEWKNGSSGSGFIVGNPAYGNNTIFVPTKDGKIYAFNATTGVELWYVSVCDGKQLNTPVTYYDHKIFFGDWDGPQKYYCYHDNGTEYWTRSSGHIYDFKTGTGTDKWAFKNEVGANPPDCNGVPSDVFSSYVNIRTDDGTMESDVTSATGNYAAHRFNFTIGEDVSEITEIKVTWNGEGWHDHAPATDGAKLYIYNYSATSAPYYDELGSTTSDQEVTLTGVTASTASNYISASSNVTILVEQRSADGGNKKDSHIKTDYVKLLVRPSGKGYYWAGAAVIGNYLVYGDDKDNLTSVEWNNVTNGEVWTADDLNVSSLPGAPTNARHIRSSIAWNATNDTYGHIFFTERYKSTGHGYLWKIGFNKSTGKFQRSDNQSRDIRYSTSTPVIYKGRVYVGGGNFSTGGSILLCANESDISQAFWEYTPNGAVQSSPALSIQGSDVYIYFTTNSRYGTCYCLKDTGSSWEERWTYTTEEAGPATTGQSNGYILQGVAISDGRVFFGNDGGYLYGINKTEHVYDFCVGAGGEDGAEKKWAYGKQTSGNPPTANNDPNTEFSTKYSPSQYDKIKVDDGVFKSDVTNANGNYAVHRFNFTILESTADISKINVTWNGTGWHDSGTQYNGTYLYIWNFTSGAYEELAHTDSGAEVTLTGENASSASNYINSDNVTVLAEQKSADDGEDHSHIATDYVKLEVTR